MSFAYGWSRMPLGVISRVSFGFWGDFGEKSQKCKKKLENLGIIRLLRRSVGNPRSGVDLCQGVGYPRRGKAKVPKWQALGTPRRSYCSK